ncbi:zinc finger CCCH domain-containing protein 39 [Raphanus sativus]|uniref:Zinc finger CCCH domain-containing protein 39 n=1 Tax=Raphanus sativus TaxID=3726 RepID=A0A6J0NR11_RAPSA|nr:zinc finger CCCH domain-containing protein 39 [Raphanus sativus]
MDSSYSDSRPYVVWNQTQMVDSTNNELSESQTMPQLKRPRLAADDNNNTSWGMVPSSNPPPMNKGTANIFYKTRMCVKFKSGACRNGELCNFAHGMEDLRQPPSNWQEIVGPPVQDREKDRERERERERLSSVSSAGDSNWEDDQKIILRMKLCRKFCFGEECPYGDRCNFIHEDLSKFREENGKLRESLAISVVDPMSVENGVAASHQVEVNRQGGIPVPAAPMINGGGGGVKTVFWKTRLCGKFEKGQCPFGDNCHFAHGQAELLQHSVGRVEGEAMNAVAAASVSKQTVVPANEPFAMKPTAQVTADSSGLNDEGRRKKCLLKWSDSKKINRIYGDWIDDLPVGQKSTKPVES